MEAVTALSSCVSFFIHPAPALSLSLMSLSSSFSSSSSFPARHAHRKRPRPEPDDDDDRDDEDEEKIEDGEDDEVGQTKTCTKCGQERSIDDFYIERRNRDGRYCQCKQCLSDAGAKRRAALDGALRELLNAARASAKARGRKGRLAAAKCTLTMKEMYIIYHRQNGRCFYFKSKVMAFISHSSWKVSLDRIDPDLGYTLSNCVIVCLEFNVSETWSSKKVQEMLALRATPTSASKIETLVADIRHRDPIRHPLPSVSCGNKCTKPRHGDKFGRNGGCTACVREYNAALVATPYGFVQKMLRGAKARSEKHGLAAPTIDVDTIIDCVRGKNGRCGVSAVPLVFCANAMWRASIEKIEPTQGYNPENVIIIAWEFNSTCNRKKRVTDDPGAPEGSGRDSQWTKAKFEEWLSYLTHTAVEERHARHRAIMIELGVQRDPVLVEQLHQRNRQRMRELGVRSFVSTHNSTLSHPHSLTRPHSHAACSIHSHF